MFRVAFQILTNRRYSICDETLDNLLFLRSRLSLHSATIDKHYVCQTVAPLYDALLEFYMLLFDN